MWSESNTHLFYPVDTAYVRVFVTDVNDNAPAFSQPVYEISVEEDKEVGFVVITVTANDEDEGNFFVVCRHVKYLIQVVLSLVFSLWFLLF